MDIKYSARIQNKAIIKNLERITNQIFKLLPCREEGGDWKAPLNNLILEVAGMDDLFENQISLFTLLCKMESLFSLTEENDFFQFRKIIFECLSLLNTIKGEVEQWAD